MGHFLFPLRESVVGCAVTKLARPFVRILLGKKSLGGLLPGVEWNQDAHLLDGRMEKLGGFVMRASNFSFINSL